MTSSEGTSRSSAPNLIGVPNRLPWPKESSSYPVRTSGLDKRFTIGAEHSLVQFVQAAIDDEMPPEARRIA